MEHTKGKVTTDVLSHRVQIFGEVNSNPYCVAEVQRGTRYDIPNADRIASLWNAANGMTTEEAVRYLEHGREMVKLLNETKGEFLSDGTHSNLFYEIVELIDELEGK
jgi:hypothetical protein